MDEGDHEKEDHSEGKIAHCGDDCEEEQRFTCHERPLDQKKDQHEEEDCDKEGSPTMDQRGLTQRGPAILTKISAMNRTGHPRWTTTEPNW